MPIAATVPGTDRKAHYGSGRQPWDDIMALGWAPEFAAGNVLKYLRRVKDPEHSLESARWYFKKLHDMVGQAVPRAQDVFTKLVGELTHEELLAVNL